MDLIRILLSILLPPVGVFVQVGLTRHFWINILLTILGYIPGIVHAVWIIARTPESQTVRAWQLQLSRPEQEKSSAP